MDNLYCINVQSYPLAYRSRGEATHLLTGLEVKLAAGCRFCLSLLRASSACKACFSSGNKFSYCIGSARDCAALALVLAKSSFQSSTTLQCSCEGRGGVVCEWGRG